MPQMKPGWPSVNLRTHRPAQQAQTRNTTMSHAPIQPLPAKKPVYSMRTQAMPVDDLNGYPLEEDDQYYTSVPAMPKSARRYVDRYGRETRQQGNQRIVIEKAPRRIRLHGFFYAGIGMLLALILWQLGSMGLTAWNSHQLDATYGNPRTYQIDMNVGHGGISHFIFENLGGHVFFEEIKVWDMRHNGLYTVTTLAGPSASSVPVTATFTDFNHDGRLDIEVNVGTDGATILYENDGTGFREVSQ